MLCLATTGSCLACSATPLPPSFAAAERHERAGQHEAALAAYRRAARQCPDQRACSAARQRIAETLEHLGRYGEALSAYLHLSRDPGAAHARGLQRAARLLERRLCDIPRAEALYQRAIVEAPNEVGAEDALRDWVALRQRRSDRAALTAILALYPRIRHSAVADNLLFTAAEIYARHGRSQEALALYDRLLVELPKSPLVDDSLWASAQLFERLRRYPAALQRYRRLLRGRRYPVLIATGSYNSVFMDRAQLRIAELQRAHLHDERAALATLRTLRDDFRDSRLRDDAQLAIAEIHHRAGRNRQACVALALLAKRFPEGNKVRVAKRLGAAWRCSAAATSRPSR